MFPKHFNALSSISLQLLLSSQVGRLLLTAAMSAGTTARQGLGTCSSPRRVMPFESIIQGMHR